MVTSWPHDEQPDLPALAGDDIGPMRVDLYFTSLRLRQRAIDAFAAARAAISSTDIGEELPSGCPVDSPESEHHPEAVCAKHADLGVTCAPCFAGHWDAHPLAEQTVCDVCGAVTVDARMTLAPLGQTVTVVMMACPSCCLDSRRVTGRD